MILATPPESLATCVPLVTVDSWQKETCIGSEVIDYPELMSPLSVIAKLEVFREKVWMADAELEAKASVRTLSWYNVPQKHSHTSFASNAASALNHRHTVVTIESANSTMCRYNTINNIFGQLCYNTAKVWLKVNLVEPPRSWDVEQTPSQWFDDFPSEWLGQPSSLSVHILVPLVMSHLGIWTYSQWWELGEIRQRKMRQD